MTFAPETFAKIYSSKIKIPIAMTFAPEHKNLLSVYLEQL